MFFETSTYTVTGTKQSAAAGCWQGVEGAIRPAEGRELLRRETPSTEPGTLAAVTGLERDCHFQTTIRPVQKRVSQTGLVNQTLKIPAFPPRAQKGCM